MRPSPTIYIHGESSIGVAQLIKSIHETYDKTDEITNFNVNNLFCLLMDNESLNFK